MATKKSKKERMKESAQQKVKEIREVSAVQSEEKTGDVAGIPVSVPRELEQPHEVLTRKDAIMVVLYSVLLFLAMTVQTGAMSMVLIVLAIASLIGKKPLENLRAHFSLPVIGLVAFAWMCGAASIYSRFGATAAAELYKLMASFSMAVILLACFEKKHVRGLLWGFATVCAVIALVCLDTGSSGKLFDIFHAFMGCMGASYDHVYSDLYKAILSERVNGIYNDANLTGALLGMAILVSVYLAHTAKKLSGRFWALTVLGVSAVSFLTAMSRGAIMAFAVAVMIYLAAEGGKTRTELFLLLLTAGGVSAAAGAVALMNLGVGKILPVLAALIAGPMAFAADWAVTGRLAQKLRGHGKVVAAMCGVLMVVFAGAAFAALQITEPYVFASDGRLNRGMALEPGEYTISGDWSGESVWLSVFCQTKEDVLTTENALLKREEADYEGLLRDAVFTVDEDTEWVLFYIWGAEGDCLNRITLSDGTEIPLEYTYLPNAIVSRLQDGLLKGHNFQLRLQFMRDGLTLFKQSPLIGHGLGSTENLLATVQPLYYESLYIHNHIVQVMDEMGVVGLLFFVLLLLGTLFVLLRRRGESQDSMVAMLIACWGMMNLHSFMEINFSIRMFQCAAFFLLLISSLCYTKPLLKKWSKLAGYVVAAVIGLQLAVFGSLLYSHRAVQEEVARFETSSAAAFMSATQDFAEREPFDKTQYQLNFVANAVMMDDVRYNSTMQKYVDDLYQTGTYAAYFGLARHYWLPQGDFDEMFACVRLAVKQAPAHSDAWNVQMDFLRYDAMPMMEADMESFIAGVLKLEEDRVKYNAERMEEVVFSQENQLFLQTVKELSGSAFSQEEIYLTLAAMNTETK